MSKNIVEKIFESHLIYGNLKLGEQIGLKIDEVYTQDATGTMCWLEFEAINIGKVNVSLAVSYIDHNMLQTNFMNADDHQFLRTSAKKFGAYFSRAGNGICHQVNLERFAQPGWIGLGTDSHTSTNGGIGMIAIGVGGLEAATTMANGKFEIAMPKVVLIKLKGKLKRPFVTAMDVILTLLKLLTVKGGVGKIFEYGGSGVINLSITERATITNMGAELGATTSVFPSDERTLEFLKSQKRQKDWIELKGDKGAKYNEIIELDLRKIEPMIAQPHSPDNIVPIKELAGKKVHQVCIGSCTNSSYQTMALVASILKGKTISEDVTLLINPGSRQVYEMLARKGLLADMIIAGARIMEIGCGACIGMGGAPGSAQVSVRSYNRNFKGRSGTRDADIYLASPVACAVIALFGQMLDPTRFNKKIPLIGEPKTFMINDNLIIPPAKDGATVTILKGPNIKEVPIKERLQDSVQAEVLLKLNNNITTDDIMPGGNKVLPYRSNIPKISKFVFEEIDKTFIERSLKAKEKGGYIIIGGENYGQGSSREHAAIALMYLGLEVVIAKSFARIHRENLINFGVLPLVFINPYDYDKVKQGDVIILKDIRVNIEKGLDIIAEIRDRKITILLGTNFNDREKNLILAGGLLSFIKTQG